MAVNWDDFQVATPAKESAEAPPATVNWDDFTVASDSAPTEKKGLLSSAFDAVTGTLSAVPDTISAGIDAAIGTAKAVPGTIAGMASDMASARRGGVGKNDYAAANALNEERLRKNQGYIEAVPAEPLQNRSRLSDVGTALNIGTTVEIPSQVVGVGTLARKFDPLEYLVPDSVKEWRGNVEEMIRGKLEGRKKELSKEYSETAKEGQKKTFFGDDASWEKLSAGGVSNVFSNMAKLDAEGKLFGEGWSNVDKILLSAAESAPSTIATMGPVGAMSKTVAIKAGKEIFDKAIASGAARSEALELAAVGSTKAAEKVAMITGGLSEGVQGAGSQYEQTRAEILGVPLKQLRLHPEWSKTIQSLPADMPIREKEIKAKEILADKGATIAASVAFGVDSVFGAVGGKYLGTAASGKGSRPGAMVSGIAQEAPTEFVQSAGEQVGTNIGVRTYADQSRGLLHDVGEQAVGGALSGGLMGGAMGGVFHSAAGPAAGITPRKSPDEIAAAVTNPGATLDEAIATAKAETGPTGDQSDAELLSLVNARTAPAQVSQPAQEVVNGTQAAQAVQNEQKAPEQDARIAGLLKTASDDSIARVAEIDKSLAQNPADETLKAERDKITTSWPATVPGKKEAVKADSGADINYQWALIPADKEVRSHDTDMRENRAYPQELQPRDRERVMSSVQAGEMQQKYNPARAGYSPDIQNGAPIISRDGVVLSGNLRSIVQARIIQEGGKKADELRQHWIDTASQYGYTSDQLRQAFKENPKLVLRRMLTDPINREEFARQANAPTTAVMSRLEQGKSDAARIDTLDDLETDESGDFTGPASRGFIRSFVAKLPVTEQGEMISSDGQLSQSGVARIRNAVLAKAYGDSPVLQRMTESLDDNMRNITKALMRVAPDVAKVRDGIKSGDLHDSDITPHILEAVEEMSRLRAEGKTLANEFAQGSMFGEKFSPETKAILTYLDANIRRPRQIGDFIKAYAEKLAAAGSPKQESLLGEAKAPAKRALIEAAQAETDDGRRANRQEMAEAVGELGDWIRQNQPGVFNITPEDEVKILPILVKIASAGIKEVGYQMKDLLANIRRALAASKNEFIKKNRGEIMRSPVLDKAIRQAIDLAQSAVPKKKGGQKDLFAGQTDTPAGQTETKTGSTADLFEQPPPAEPKKEAEPAKESKPDQEKKRERPSVSVPKGLKITLEREIGGKTESKLVDAKKALDISSRNVEKLEALRGCLG